MNTYNKRNRFGGGEKGDRRGANFGKKNFKGQTELFQATCAACAKTCEVPFRPNGKKPVYCKDCFDRNGGGGNDFKNDFKPRYDRPERFERSERPTRDSSTDDLKRQLDMVTAKLDTLIQLMSQKFHTESTPVEVVTKAKKPRSKK